MPRQDSLAWIFVSHSNRDLEKVRRVRNAIEEAGGQPLLFFLKCLSDDDELDGLIKREIEARTFFLLCDSGHAKESDKVRYEFDYVRSLDGKKVEMIDLDGQWEAQLEGTLRLLQGATVFFSYAHDDWDAIRPLYEALAEHDFAVWSDAESLQPGTDWQSETLGAIERAAHEGYVLLFLSARSRHSRWVEMVVEKALASNRSARIFPILLDPPGTFDAAALPYRLEHVWLDFSDRDVERFLPHLLGALGVGPVGS